MRFAQQKSEVETSGVGFSPRNCSMASYECIHVVLSGAMYDIVQSFCWSTWTTLWKPLWNGFANKFWNSTSVVFSGLLALSSGEAWAIVEFVSTGFDTSSVAKPWYKSSKVSAISRQMLLPSSLATMLPPCGIDVFGCRVDRSWTGVTAGPGGGISSTGLSGEGISTVVSAKFDVPLGDMAGDRCVVVVDVGAWIGASIR